MPPEQDTLKIKGDSNYLTKFLRARGKSNRIKTKSKEHQSIQVLDPDKEQHKNSLDQDRQANSISLNFSGIDPLLLKITIQLKPNLNHSLIF